MGYALLSSVKKVNNMEIVTNNKPRDIVSFFELKKKHREEMRDVFNEMAEDLQFFIYKDGVYCLDDFCVVDKKGQLSKHWDAVLGTSYFTAIVIRVTNCGESVIVGMAYE